MRITDVKTVLLTGPCTDNPFLSRARRYRSASYVEIITDTPHVGIGENYNDYRCAELIPVAVKYIAPILIGQDVQDIPELFPRMYHCENFWCPNGFGLSVINAIEAALWDLKGKLENKPVYELLGGAKHASLDCYASGGPSNYPKDELARKIDFYLSLGFRRFKIGAGALNAKQGWVQPALDEAADFEADKVAFVRNHLGPDVKICLDGHMDNCPVKDATWDLQTAIGVMKAVEPFDLFFFEEPLHYDDPWGYAELCRATDVPIAGGECLTGVSEWRMFVEKDCFDIGQPDASYTGGLEIYMTVAKLLQERGRKIATHAWGAGASLMQNIHVGFAAGDTTILEIPPTYGPLHQMMIGDSLKIKDGNVLPPEQPGLGVTLSYEIKKRFPFIPGSGEFNDVPGKKLADWEQKVDAQYSH